MRISEPAQVVVEQVTVIVVYNTIKKLYYKIRSGNRNSSISYSIKLVYPKSLRISEEFMLCNKSMDSFTTRKDRSYLTAWFSPPCM